jgi:hypothetical protein
MSIFEYLGTTYVLAKYALILYVVYLVVKRIQRKYFNKALNLPKWTGKREFPPIEEWAKTQKGRTDIRWIKCFNPGNMETLCEDLPAMTPEMV